MKNLIYFLVLLFMFSCGSKSDSDTGEEEATGEKSKPTEEVADRIHQEVITEDTINLPAEDLWSLVSDFGGLEQLLPDTFSSVEVEGSGEGATRTLTLGDGSGEIVEELTLFDQQAKYLEYKMISTPMPVTNYQASMAVRRYDDNSSVLTWISEYDVSPENEGFKENIKMTHQKLFSTLKEIADAL